MADENTSTVDALKKDINSMKEQLEELIKNASAKGHAATDDLATRILKEWGEYSNKASEQAEKLRNAGHAGLDEIGHQVRRNPIMSIAIAFGVGYLVSCMLRHMR